jgi:aspartyl-tRNA(Asn)/glutamyl-tRNA(Gln) amidotransferase subunit A
LPTSPSPRRRGGSRRGYITLDAERALAAARAAETEIATGRYRGALHGIPLALKDAYDTAGVRTTVGSRLFEDNMPTSDAHAWARLKNAGAILLGKLETTELCYGGPSPDGLFPACKNPWDPSCYAGGSSSGAGVALAAGLCLGALGTDTGGSIRLPAAYCGITGLMASTGLVGGSGVFPLSHSLDHFGPMARSAEDCAILLNALVGIDPNDPRSVVSPVGDYRVRLDQPIKGLRVGLVAAMLDGAFTSADTIAATLAAAQVLRGLGAVVSDAPFPDMFDFAACQLVITAAEAFALHEKALQQRRADFSYYTRTRISLAPLVRAVDYVEAKRVRRALNASYRDLMGAYDVLLLPGAPGPAPKAAQVGAFDFMKKPLVTMPANVLGCAAISLPAGFSATGLPLAIQLQGPRLGEATVLRAAHAFQMATDWHRARPEL